MEFGLPDDNNNISLKKFESMLKTNNVLFFDSNEFENIMHTISRNHRTCYIMGDFNLNLLDFAKVSNVSNFLDMFFSFGFYPLFNKPTRITKDSATLLDNFLQIQPMKTPFPEFVFLI